MHQPAVSGVIEGQATDLDIQATEILKVRAQIVDIYSKFTKKDKKEIEAAIDRDKWMSAEEALQFGHIDKIVESFDAIK